jgi:hypothetical protein
LPALAVAPLYAPQSERRMPAMPAGSLVVSDARVELSSTFDRVAVRLAEKGEDR